MKTPPYTISAVTALIVLSIFIGIRATSVHAATSTLDGAINGQQTSLDSYKLLEPLPCIPNKANDCTSGGGLITEVDISTYINYLFRFAIAIAALLAVFMFTIGGFQYMTSEAIGGKDDGKKHMQNAVWGILAAISSYVILYTIDPRLVSTRPNIPALELKQHTDIFANLDQNIATTQKGYRDWINASNKAIRDAAEGDAKISEIQNSINDTQDLLNDPLLDNETSALLTKDLQDLIDEKNQVTDITNLTREKGKLEGKINAAVIGVCNQAIFTAKVACEKSALADLAATKDELNKALYTPSGIKFQTTDGDAALKIYNDVFWSEREYSKAILDNKMILESANLAIAQLGNREQDKQATLRNNAIQAIQANQKAALTKEWVNDDTRKRYLDTSYGMIQQLYVTDNQ